MPAMAAGLLALTAVAIAAPAANNGANNNGGNAKPNAPAAAAATPTDDAIQIYRALIAKQCPARHLELLSESELDDLIEVNFHDGLPASLQSRLEAADKDEKQACANTTGGVACFNAAYMRAMNDVKILPRFARMVCGSGLTCRGPAACGREE